MTTKAQALKAAKAKWGDDIFISTHGGSITVHRSSMEGGRYAQLASYGSYGGNRSSAYSRLVSEVEAKK